MADRIARCECAASCMLTHPRLTLSSLRSLGIKYRENTSLGNDNNSWGLLLMPLLLVMKVMADCRLVHGVGGPGGWWCATCGVLGVPTEGWGVGRQLQLLPSSMVAGL